MAARKKHSREEAIELLRQIDESIAKGKTNAESCMEANVSKSMYLRWRKENSHAADNPMQRLRKLEDENANLRWLVAELCLHKLVLRDLIGSGGSKI